MAKTQKTSTRTAKIFYTPAPNHIVAPISGAFITSSLDSNLIQVKFYFESPKYPKETMLKFDQQSKKYTEDLQIEGGERMIFATFSIDAKDAKNIASILLEQAEQILQK